MKGFRQGVTCIPSHRSQDHLPRDILTNKERLLLNSTFNKLHGKKRHTLRNIKINYLGDHQSRDEARVRSAVRVVGGRVLRTPSSPIPLFVRRTKSGQSRNHVCPCPRSFSTTSRDPL